MHDQRAGLTGRVAVVTGAGSGMGRVMALELARRGAKLAAVDVDAARLTHLGEELGANAGAFVAVPTDVSRAADCRRAVERVVAAFGSLTILVNCAGVSMDPAIPAGKQHPVRFWETDPDGWERIQAIDSAGPYFMTRFAVEHMFANGWGRIINVTTSFDTMLARGMSAYGAAKAALEASSAIWAKELEGSGVSVNVVVPGGMTNTPFLPPEFRSASILQPEIMAPVVGWLASPDADGVNGRRFVAKLWDASLSPAQAAAKCGAPIAWEGEAALASRSK
ncbi:MAG: SDR family oxidoreductase [Candidatus Lustribacter sp.]|jgi:NAD(P)-dependent dehydrogenase (short-subunit alcohol dehydrogenase family)